MKTISIKKKAPIGLVKIALVDQALTARKQSYEIGKIADEKGSKKLKRSK